MPCSLGYSVQILETFLFSGPSLFESVCVREKAHFFFRVVFSFQKLREGIPLLYAGIEPEAHCVASVGHQCSNHSAIRFPNKK